MREETLFEKGVRISAENAKLEERNRVLRILLDIEIPQNIKINLVNKINEN